MLHRTAVFSALAAAYALLTAAVLGKTAVLDVDAAVAGLDLRHRYAELYPWLHTYVMLGQRGPATLATLPFFLWVAHRARSARPLVMLGVALVVLNASVGAVKLATGRLGPRYGDSVSALFSGGSIYPSGHVANAVVLYGLIALLVPARGRVAAVVAGSVIASSVGVATFFLNTHWVTDVVGGILAGALVLCSLPWLVPPAEALLARLAARCSGPFRARFRARSSRRSASRTAPTALPPPARCATLRSTRPDADIQSAA
jgi:undecaprenyl-diphosphatase